ncbi:DUF3631 domain-containing protein [Mycolicibacterium sp. 050158]|uniref:DUF3631 domain-containing protein n=1 Tax=Mycolicibacterium sp. 050158 TaxID=3090602 RepID=UPI00299E180D|nr:DUF3631 domain-containing protein [Mycolicibacterium sp. 050158]MDX1890121.1 DUF3631 domain-containing protein [Mycolicibacterium sp. 050158]
MTQDRTVAAPTGAATPGAQILDSVWNWLRRFIAVPDDRDLLLLTLWIISTHLAVELYTSPRLLIDSTMPGSGKTTVLDHLNRLAWKAVQAASLSSPALLVRMLEHGVRTVLIDEVDRSLSPNKPGVEDLIGILNSGYRRGATRPVLVPEKGGGWLVREMPTFAPVAMAGNSPRLPDDTLSRSIRILLMPDIDGTIEDSDWEVLDPEAEALHDQICSFADCVRGDMASLVVDLPASCVGRAKEKWRPLKRVAVAAGGRWPAIADELIARSLNEDADEKEAGLRTLPPGMVLMTDLHTIWPEEDFVPTKDLVSKLVLHNPEYWGAGSSYGKPLTDTRLGRMVAQASKITSARPGGRGPRGYHRTEFDQVWHRLGIGRSEPGAPGYPGAPGADNNQVHRLNQVHRVETDSPDEPGEPGINQPSPASMPQRPAYAKPVREPRERTRGKYRAPTGPGRCDTCGWHTATQGHDLGCSSANKASA